MIDNMNAVLLENMQREKIDVDLSRAVLERLNSGDITPAAGSGGLSIPHIDGRQILDARGDIRFSVPEKKLMESAEELGLSKYVAQTADISNNEAAFDRRGLERFGLLLLPFAAYGVLNGGSASSYIDPQKNRAFDPALFDLYQPEFEHLAALCANKPKGITSAFLNPDGAPGPNFLELKLRALLCRSYRYSLVTGKPLLIPFFQMTSVSSDAELARAWERAMEGPLIADLAAETGFTPRKILTGVQPMLAAFTHSADGAPRRIFSAAHGRPNAPLPMPGGHGQNFYVLADVYRRLRGQGIRFAWLGNVDNSGFTVDPAALALAFLSGCDAAFEFSFRTPIDVKGGVLVRHAEGRLDCRDIGPAIGFDEITRAEAAGEKILFNCAIGLFNLDYLTAHLDRIIRELPLRVSDQDKAAGRYAQAEQITWEVISLLSNPLILGVDKYERFLAVKVLVEGLMTSGFKLDDPNFPTRADEAKDLKRLAVRLHRGLAAKLSTVYAMKEEKGRWVPKSLAEIRAETPWPQF